MSSKTVYTCDKCIKTSEKNDLWQVNINTFPVELEQRSSFVRDALHTTQWCRKCMEKAHLLPARLIPQKNLPKPPTFEELLQDIIETAVDNALDERI